MVLDLVGCCGAPGGSTNHGLILYCCSAYCKYNLVFCGLKSARCCGFALDSGWRGRHNAGMSEKKARPVNVRRPEIMELVRGDIARYSSELVERIRSNGSRLELPGMELRLATAFGFCDGVRRAIEMAYATCAMFKGSRIWLIGEIIHNPEVNARLDALGLRHLPWDAASPEYAALGEEDVVIIPAFGVPVSMRRLLEERGVQLVDTTCGNVVKVWQRVKQYAAAGITSIIHGKAKHEESRATASHSRGADRQGKFLIIFSEEDAQLLADYICGKGDKAAFMTHFAGCHSENFDPDRDLADIGMANQTTMLKDETAHIQRLLRAAVAQRDGSDARFHMFDTICGATQDRQNALFELLEQQPDIMVIVGGYNSSNTTHLASIAARRVPTYFVDSADCLLGGRAVRSYDTATRRVVEAELPAVVEDPARTLRIGITAGASCPANVIEQVIRKLAALRGHEI